MIKRVISAIIAVVIVAGMAGCAKKSVIPDDVLADIFHDAFVVNAYVDVGRVNIDSLQIYEPIFERYGYTAKDVIYTVGNFSRRKSARLGSVVERAISRLERENKLYTQRVVILDTIQNFAVREFTRTVHKDTLIDVKKRADSTLLQLEISPISKGEYTINYSYKCDGDLEKYPRKAEFYLVDEDGFRSGYTSVSIGELGKVMRTIVARKPGYKLVINLGKVEKRSESKNKSGKKEKKSRKKDTSKRSTITIRNLKVTYKPNTDNAIDSLFSRYVDVKIFADEFLFKKDSLTLSADTTRVL